MSQTAINAELESEFAAVAASSGCELVHVDYRQGRLRVFLDRPQGVTLDDCQTVSKQLSALLDVSEFGSSRYLLEVSSPGLDRELHGPKDYRRFSGQTVRVTFFSGEPRTQKTIVGRLQACQPEAGDDPELATGGAPVEPRGVTEGITVTDSQQRYAIPLRDIKIARLEPEL